MHFSIDFLSSTSAGTPPSLIPGGLEKYVMKTFPPSGKTFQHTFFLATSQEGGRSTA